MGNVSVVELEHDRWDEIFKDRNSENQFLEEIRRQIASPRYRREIRGGRVIFGCHISDRTYKDWCKFKEKISNRK